MNWSKTIKIEIQANTIDNLLETFNEIKKQISKGYAMAHDKNEFRRYAYNIEQAE